MSLFHKLGFATPDPLANGLDEDIAAEQSEAEAIHSLADPNGDELQENWSRIVKDVEEDPDWFTFTND